MQRFDRRLDRCISYFQHRTCCRSYCQTFHGRCPTFTGLLLLPLSVFILIFVVSQSTLLQADFETYVNGINSKQTCSAYCGEDRSFSGAADTDCCRRDGLSCMKKAECYMERASDFNMKLMIYGMTILLVGTYVFIYLGYYFIRFTACLGRCINPVEEQVEENEAIEGLLSNRNGLQRLPVSETVEQSEEICAICLGGYEKSKVIRLKCQHIFHAECIRRWMIRSNKCPVCRSVS